MRPAAPPTLLPVRRSTAPESAPTDDPDDTVVVPLAPVAELAVDNDARPLEPLALEPLVTTTSPPAPAPSDSPATTDT
jgi:hypothetical protein